MTTLFNFNLAKSTGVIYYSKKDIIRKFSLTTNKRKLLNEYKGFKWYFEKSKIKIKNKTPLIEYFKKENYINLPLIKGNKVPFWHSIKETKSLIEILINHYLKVWPKNNITPWIKLGSIFPSFHWRHPSVYWGTAEGRAKAAQLINDDMYNV